MIKEIFEIEPKQKNILIILVGIFGLSFLQLYLFKDSIFDLGIIQTVGIALGLTVCWTILNIPSIILCFGALTNFENKDDSLNYDLIIFTFGLLAIGWISLLTFIAYELELSFKWFLRISVGVSVLRITTWFFIALIKNKRSGNQKK